MEAGSRKAPNPRAWTVEKDHGELKPSANQRTHLSRPPAGDLTTRHAPPPQLPDHRSRPPAAAVTEKKKVMKKRYLHIVNKTAIPTTFVALLFNHASTAHGILARVNAEFYSVLRGHSFMTAYCAIIDCDGRLSFAGASHPPLLIRRRAGLALHDDRHRPKAGDR